MDPSVTLTCVAGKIPGWLGKNEGDHRIAVFSTLPPALFTPYLTDVTAVA